MDALWPYEVVQQPKSSMTQRSTDRTQGMILLAAVTCDVRQTRLNQDA